MSWSIEIKNPKTKGTGCESERSPWIQESQNIGIWLRGRAHVPRVHKYGKSNTEGSGGEAGIMFLESGNPGIPKQRELADRQGPCSWCLKSKNRMNWLRGRALVLDYGNQGIQDEIEWVERQSPCSSRKPKTTGNWLRGRAHVPRVQKSRNPKTEGIG